MMMNGMFLRRGRRTSISDGSSIDNGQDGDESEGDGSSDKKMATIADLFVEYYGRL